VLSRNRASSRTGTWQHDRRVCIKRGFDPCSLLRLLVAGKAQADAAAAAGVKVFVFSTLEDVDKRSKVQPEPVSEPTQHLALAHTCIWPRRASGPDCHRHPHQ
jgi:hypothetical protein